VIVVHALWREGRLALWAEDALLPVRPDGARPRPTATARRSRTAPHPFAAPADSLANALGDVLADLATKAATGTVELALPTRGGAPADSPELVREELPGSGRGALTLRGWLVETVEYDADDALTVIRSITAADPPGLTTGATLRHALDLVDFAADLVARGRLLPSVVTDADGPRAVWRPVLTAGDAAWARALTLALPPAARAIGTDNGGEPSAADTVAAALDALVDSTARSVLAPLAPGSAVPAWLAALTGRQRRFTAESEAVAELAAALAEWQRDANGGRVRALFRLVEPGSDDQDDGTAQGGGTAEGGTDEVWRVEFALQAAEEPSLVVDADQVWRSRGAMKALARHLDSPQETLLAELGRACRLYPPLETALRTAAPSTLDLDGEGAHGFLTGGAPLLAAAGFGVLLPRWWSKPRARLGVRLNASTKIAPGTVQKKSTLGLNSIVDYRWQLSLGDQPLTAAEMKALSEAKTPLIRVRGQWVELDPKRLAAGLKLLTKGGQMTVVDLLHAGLSMSDGPGGLPVVSVAADGPLGDLLDGQAERHLQPVAAPDGFEGTLRPYQERGLAWMTFLESLGLGGILADDMGLGKTAMVLALVASDEVDTGPTLVLCPMSLVGNWEREATKFAPHLRVHIHHGAERARGRTFVDAVTGADVVITTYALAARDAEALAEIAWHRLVVDEAQAIKNAATKQAAAVRALPGRNRIAVTGTPVENRLADLWSIMEFANPGLLGAALSFKVRFAEPIERRGDEVAAERLKRLTGPFILRRLKTDRSIISDLPEKLEMEILCNLTAEQASLYQAVVTDMMRKIEESEGIERRGLVLATMTKLKQVCNHPAHLLHDGTPLAGRSGKLARLEEILDEVLANGERALLFTQYAEFGGMLRSHLAARFGREVAFLHGGVPKLERDRMVTRFQSTDRTAPSLFVLSLKAGGTGLNLTAANHVVHVDRWWNPAVEDQATDRAFRIGQTRSVQVRKFVCAGTVEEKISEMIREKRGLAARIVGTGEQWLTEMSTSELRNLFALEAGAVVE
jgi:non-specific serine/threonine protein kinase